MSDIGRNMSRIERDVQIWDSPRHARRRQTETQWLGRLSSEAIKAMVHLDRKLERMLAMLLRLKELREAPDSDPESSGSWVGPSGSCQRSHLLCGRVRVRPRPWRSSFIA